ncbi:cytochrome ubiquinol oxidase subunit I [Campylobacter sp. 19-13652]|uniref:cytochrome ubiquinol oxidase subunit I n=1 Tax=Campylobacter sp. 19-13652 TaxID=2840180 RepID=UPI001C778201|nr:cytochrome ubiquinol oxidase subunit I [Campylobacter sp. 19-13652]BCX80263.1 cytochrome ubiquinol oxidase subunit I [Campylobacter sp. 19-13652]
MAELASVDLSRLQFAITALYHFLFVPLTLGLSFIVAIMESIYVKTGSEQWLRITHFWLKLFGINFAIGVATGIIMEFEFGTNWANYSWFVGDIFGAPLAIEGLLAFFLEATFFAVMFFGWGKVSKGFHLLSSWLVAIGSNLSAMWILIANGWMQYPVGMSFNPETARMEMDSFLEVALNPVGIVKFLHTITSGYVIAALFVLGISAWYLLKKQHFEMAKKSMVVAASFGIISSGFLLLSGDESAYLVAKHQPMKLAAMEGLYRGEERQGLVAFGVLNPDKKPGDDEPVFLANIEVPYMLSLLAKRNINEFVPGIDQLVFGDKQRGIMSVGEKMLLGAQALDALREFKKAKSEGDTQAMSEAKSELETNWRYIGYGYLKNPAKAVPPVATTFYAFHIMVALGSLFVGLFFVVLYLAMANRIEKFKNILRACVACIPLGYVAAEAGWVVAEVGRQPWAVQDLLPVGVAATNLASTSVGVSIALFILLFTTLLIAEVRIMLSAIKKGF